MAEGLHRPLLSRVSSIMVNRHSWSGGNKIADYHMQARGGGGGANSCFK